MAELQKVLEKIIRPYHSPLTNPLTLAPWLSFGPQSARPTPRGRCQLCSGTGLSDFMGLKQKFRAPKERKGENIQKKWYFVFNSKQVA